MKISIITAVKNGAGMIEDCIDSVRRQTYPAEHIIIDGFSTDGTKEIIKKYKNSISKMISEPDHGIYDALNKGIKLAAGDVIGFLHCDDIYAHEKVLEKVEEVFKNKMVESCYGDLLYVKKDNIEKIIRYWKSSEYRPEKLKFGWMPPHPTFFVKREIYEKYGVFNLELGSAADYELMLRFLLKYRISTAYIPEVLVKMRVGGTSNRSLKNRIRANLMDRKAWRINGLKPYPWTLWFKPLRKLPQFLPLLHLSTS